VSDFLRSAHGTEAATTPSLVVVEQPPPAELPIAPAAGAAPIRRVRGRVTTAADAAALARLPRGSFFAPRALVCDPRFRPHNRRRMAWTRRRRGELQAQTGAVSHGVGAMLVSAGWLYAASEFAAELGAASGDLEAFRLSATLSQTARQHDLAAWSLACRESEHRDTTGDDLAERQRAFQAELARRQGGK